MMIAKLFTAVFTTTKVQYISMLSWQEVVRRLDLKIEPENYLNPFSSFMAAKPYGGYVRGSKFNMVPHKFIIVSLKPGISGNIYCQDDKTIIEVDLQSSTGAYSGFILTVALLFVIVNFPRTMEMFELIPVLVLPALLVFNNLIYIVNIKECLSDLSKIFDANPIEV